MSNIIYSINGPIVTVKDTKDFSMLEMVYVGNNKLIGEVIGVSNKCTTIQVYEITTSLSPGEPVYGTNMPLVANLGPGILSNIFDGIERPLKSIEKISGAFLDKGCNIFSLDTERLYDVTITVSEGDYIKPGDIYATCPETDLIIHKCILSPLYEGKVVSVKPNGKYNVEDIIVQIEDKNNNIINLSLYQKWPIRTPRPIKNRLAINKLLTTGQRVIDSIFPIAKGGTATIPGGFGTGKTMTQHQLAKWCDADIIVYIGCGERGNEMTQVLHEFSSLIDPRTSRPLTDRTTLIANTSNMPVAAREASIYTGITIAEYYRDMGYDVAVMADSTSRWAEALREISGRLEEMPAEEGFPAYLPSRISQFYERAGYMENLNGTKGSVSIIGAVSPQGADFSEPVTQNTKRFTRCFWALDKSLAYIRHYPSINWNDSYSEYIDELKYFYKENVDIDFLDYRQRIINILNDEDNLMEIVKLIGSDVLTDDQKLIIEIAKVVRVGFLQQNAYNKIDTFVPLKKQLMMIKIILYLYDKLKIIVKKNIPLSLVIEKDLFEKIIKLKYEIKNDELEKFDKYYDLIDYTLNEIESNRI